MPRPTQTLVVMLTLALISPFGSLGVAAQEDAGDSASPFSLGIQSSWPVYGISGKYDTSEKVQAQLVVGTGSVYNGVQGRANYFFQMEEKYSWLAFGSVSFVRRDLISRDDDNSISFGGGAGIELDWAAIFEDDEFPSFFSTIDLGIQLSPGFDDIPGVDTFPLFLWGGSLHYHF